MDPHEFVADQDPAVLLNVDPDPAAKKMRIRIRLNNGVCPHLVNF